MKRLLLALGTSLLLTGAAYAQDVTIGVAGRILQWAWCPTNTKTRARMLIGNAAKARFGARSGRPDDGVAPGRERWLVAVRMREI